MNLVIKDKFFEFLINLMAKPYFSIEKSHLSLEVFFYFDVN